MAFGLLKKRAGSAPGDGPDTQDGSRYTDDARTIAAAFRHFRDQRTSLTLQFQGLSTPYQAKVLDVTDGVLLIEDIQPREGLQHLRTALPFSVAGRSQGMYLYANGIQCLSSEAERGIPYFRLALPESVLHQQRRKSPRVELPMTVKAQGARISIVRAGEELSGDILDLSAGGLRAQFFEQPVPSLASEERLDVCVLHIRDQLDLTSSATVRHVDHDPVSEQLSCGLELTEMSVTDRRRLEYFVQSLANRRPLPVGR